MSQDQTDKDSHAEAIAGREATEVCKGGVNLALVSDPDDARRAKGDPSHPKEHS